MPRFLLTALAALLLLLPATASGSSSAKLRGTVAAKFPANGLIRVESRPLAHILRVPGSQARIRVGQRVELRGTTLRQRGRSARILARNVVVARSIVLGQSTSQTGGTLAPNDDDELEVKGTLASLSPLRVVTASGFAVCSVSAGNTLAGFAVGDLVEMTCDLRSGVWVLRKLEHEDDEGIGAGADEDHDNSGPGDDDEDDDDDDNSGPGNGDDDDDDDSGPGNDDD
jgi:hypothetical protein